MNKLQGFMELRKSGLPAVPWQKYTSETTLDNTILWTIRTAVMEGDDQNLPRKVGVDAATATQFAEEISKTLPHGSLVLYYPFFIAEKSGVLEISPYRTVIETVAEDLWNLVTYNKRDLSIIFENDDIKFDGNEYFLETDEVNELIDYCVRIRRLYSSYLASGKSVFLEWSYAKKSDINKNSIGEKALVFYEIRTV